MGAKAPSPIARSEAASAPLQPLESNCGLLRCQPSRQEREATPDAAELRAGRRAAWSGRAYLTRREATSRSPLPALAKVAAAAALRPASVRCLASRARPEAAQRLPAAA